MDNGAKSEVVKCTRTDVACAAHALLHRQREGPWLRHLTLADWPSTRGGPCQAQWWERTGTNPEHGLEKSVLPAAQML